MNLSLKQPRRNLMLFVIEKNENQSIYNFNIHHKGIAGGKKQEYHGYIYEARC